MTNKGIKVFLSVENEDWVRSRNRRKGDISRIINECVDVQRLKKK